MWVTSDSDSFCSESAAADAPAAGKASPPPHAASLTGGGVGGCPFAARTVTVRSYPRVRSSPHLPYTILSPEKWGYRISPDSTRILNRILSVTRLHIHVFYPCTLVYTCNSNLVPNTSAVYFISTYTKDFTVILRSFSRMREQIAPGSFSSPQKTAWARG